MTTLKTITDHELRNITGGADKQDGGGKSWVGQQWQGVKDRVSDSLKGAGRDFFGPASKYLGL